MASTSWALLLFLAQLHILFPTSSAHADANNLNRLSVPFLCNPDQADSLLQLKKSFFFHGSTTRLQSWRDGTDCCVWEGVGCDASGNVTVLDLNNRGLSSLGLHPAIFNLTSLRRLDLSMNDFGRDIDYIFYLQDTARFETFTMLTHLNLSNMGLEGKVPFSIRKLVNLLSLDLSTSFDLSDSNGPFGNENNLYESNFGTLVENLGNLRELRLDAVDLSGNDDWCISLATYVPYLKVLSLDSCRLSGLVHKSLSRLQSLSMINLQFNYDITAGPFPDFFMGFLNLTVLQLSRTNLQGWFPSKSFQSKNLRVLDLSSNCNLSGYMPNFSNASSLETLRLEGTNFSFAKQESSSDLKLLKELSLDGNLVSVDFLSSLGRLGSLGQLYLGFGSINELGSIFTWIGYHNNLTSLELSGCNFSMATPSSVSNFKHLRRLTMIDSNLPGPIISAIGDLMHLQTLEMEGCKTYGSIPSSFGNLKSLINIYVSGSWVSGPLPAAIGNLTNLERMVIQFSSISGTVPCTVGQLNKLRQLILEECNLSGTIPSSIANLTRLKILNLSHNGLQGEVPSSIFTMPVLRDLDLSGNKLFGPIREFNQAISQLKSLDLSSNEFSGPIPNSFLHLTSLIQLDLSSNNLNGLVDLASFWRLRNIDILNLSHNKLAVIDGQGSPLPSDWSGPRVLGLASCNITQFPILLTFSKDILALDLSRNEIRGDVPKQLWETWSSSLTYLNLSNNMLTGTQLTSDVIPLSTLQTLDLSFNRFQGHIPMPNSSAEFMDYSNNMFSSVLPNFTWYLRGTSYLSMSKNIIYGRIPYSICNSTSRLEVLDLSYNIFNGPFPSCLMEEKGRMAVLNLRENHFEGMLPSNITNVCLLEMIDLHGNEIYGKLPRRLSNCLQLEVLDLGSNQVVDTFPSWLRGLPKLSVIVLRSNQLNGSIGDFVGDTKSTESFPSLQIIDLSSNQFSGNLRSQWFEQLKSMIATFNNTEHIVAAGNMSFTDEYQYSTEITYKGSDMIFERILTTLTEIDLSNNRLEGTIPESIGRLVALRALNLSHNSFTGEIPAQLGGMTDLESLDLSCNKLSGKIPQELTNLTFLDVLNLSSNHLEGKVPQSRQFSTFGSNSFEGNAGLCGAPVSELPCGASPYTPCVTNVHKSSHHVDVVLFLFVGLGFGVGFAAAISVKWGRVRQMVYCNCKGFANLIAARR